MVGSVQRPTALALCLFACASSVEGPPSPETLPPLLVLRDTAAGVSLHAASFEAEVETLAEVDAPSGVRSFQSSPDGRTALVSTNVRGAAPPFARQRLLVDLVNGTAVDLVDVLASADGGELCREAQWIAGGLAYPGFRWVPLDDGDLLVECFRAIDTDPAPEAALVFRVDPLRRVATRALPDDECVRVLGDAGASLRLLRGPSCGSLERVVFDRRIDDEHTLPSDDSFLSVTAAPAGYFFSRATDEGRAIDWYRTGASEGTLAGHVVRALGAAPDGAVLTIARAEADVLQLAIHEPARRIELPIRCSHPTAAPRTRWSRDGAHAYVDCDPSFVVGRDGSAEELARPEGRVDVSWSLDGTAMLRQVRPDAGDAPTRSERIDLDGAVTPLPFENVRWRRELPRF